MVFPFGVSVSDFIAGIKLFKDGVNSLSGTRGARADFAELSRALDSLDRALNSVPTNIPSTGARQQALDATINDCKTCVSNFLVTVAKFDVLRDKNLSEGKIVTGFRKIQWGLCKEEDVKKFRSQVDMHVGALEMLLLTFQIETTLSIETKTRDSNATLKRVETDVRKCLSGQLETIGQAKQSHCAQMTELSSVKEEVRSTVSNIADQLSALLDLQSGLQRGLSAVEQHKMFELLQETVIRNCRLEQEMQRFFYQNKGLETHILEIKASIQVQREIPAQVLLQRPVVLNDPLGRTTPFHLEFITCSEALLAVLRVRFKDVGLTKVNRREFSLRDSRKDRQIDIDEHWDKVFLPGQHVDMSMVFPDVGLSQASCPGCHTLCGHLIQEQEQVQCLKCPMTYRWYRKPLQLDGPYLNAETADSLNTKTEDIEQVSSFCRVEMVEDFVKLPE